MDVNKRYVTQWQIPGRPDDGNERIWTEVRFDVDDLAELLGLAEGTRLISMTIDRDHSTMVWTFEEPKEALCQSRAASDVSSAGESSGGSATA